MVPVEVWNRSAKPSATRLRRVFCCGCQEDAPRGAARRAEQRAPSRRDRDRSPAALCADVPARVRQPLDEGHADAEEAVRALRYCAAWADPLCLLQNEPAAQGAQRAEAAGGLATQAQ